MLKLFKYFKTNEWLQMCVCAVFIVAQVWLDLKLPEYMQEITRLVQTEGSAISSIWENGGMMLLCALGSLVGAIIVGFFAARLGASFSRRLRSNLFEKVDSFSMGEINKFSTASLITRSTNDVSQVQMFIAMGMQLIIKAPVMAIWALIKITGKGVEWSIATGVAVAILLTTFAFILVFLMPKFKKMQTITDDLNRVTRENLTGLPVVRAYNADGYQRAKFEKVNTELTETQLFTSRGMAFLMPVITLITSFLPLAIYWIGATLINQAGILDKLPIFMNLVVFTQYAMQIIMAFMMMAMMFIFLPRAAISAKRINEVLDTRPSITDGSITDGMPGKEGEVEFRNVSFKYPSAADYVLKDITFTANKGETVAFIGSTGSGKSTLINLIPRFFDATEGEISIDGVNIKDYKLESLYNKIGYIPQKAVLFNGTVTSNIAFGESGMEQTEEDVKKAVSIAQAKEFVEKMEGGYDAEIARGGANISGGQKQRLAIARAICRKPEIYIFDDSFSALDYKTDRVLRTALKKQTKGVTSFIVAQRIGTIMDADRIVVLDNGKVVGIGTHKQLLKTCGVYKEIAMSQLSEEELAL